MPCFYGRICGKYFFVSFKNGVDQRFIGAPPFPQEKAERMEHGSLQQKTNLP
jgi:hypothetical protein